MPPKQRASLHGSQLRGLQRGESDHTTTALSPFPRAPLDRAGERQKIDWYWKSSNEKYCVSQVIITCDSSVYRQTLNHGDPLLINQSETNAYSKPWIELSKRQIFK